MRTLRRCDETGLHHQGEEAVLLLLLRPRYQTGRTLLPYRAERCCPIGKIGSATVEDAVKDQTKKIFETTYFQEQIAAQTGITINELMELFKDSFWQESNPQELNRLYSELFEKIILKENQIIYEIKTSGVQALIEGVTNEYQ